MNRIDVSKIILGTGNYKNVKYGNTVSITGDGGNAWGYYGQAYKKLAPRLFTYTQYAEKLEILKTLKEDIINVKRYLEYRRQIEAEYIKSYYETRLKSLDVYELLEILENKYGREIILLCHEPIDEFCHRRLIADYIELKTGIYIPEIVSSSNDKFNRVSPIRYKKSLQKIMY